MTSLLNVLTIVSICLKLSMATAFEIENKMKDNETEEAQPSRGLDPPSKAATLYKDTNEMDQANGKKEQFILQSEKTTSAPSDRYDETNQHEQKQIRIKRNSNNIRTFGIPTLDFHAVDKRRWGQSRAKVWGKRSIFEDNNRQKLGRGKSRNMGKRSAPNEDERQDDEVWGTDYIGNAKRRWGQNSAKVWGKRDETLDSELQKRKWGKNNAKVWGKRDAENIDKRKWGKNNAKVWGKRDVEEVDKRKWGKNNAKVWGKRNDFIETDKRKWGKNNAKVWGKRDSYEIEKRKWGKNNAKVWGKRDSQELDNQQMNQNIADNIKKEELIDEKEITLGENRKLFVPQGDKLSTNQGSLLGALNFKSENQLSDENSPSANEKISPSYWGKLKRKWGKNNAKVWGKRESVADENENAASEEISPSYRGEVKRKWGKNNAKVWGKREWAADEKQELNTRAKLLNNFGEGAPLASDQEEVGGFPVTLHQE